MASDRHADAVGYDDTHDLAWERMSRIRWAIFTVGLWIVSGISAWLAVTEFGLPVSMAVPSALAMVPAAAFFGAFIEYCVKRAQIIHETEAYYED